jgi:4-hydroxy 2-oxovalerate aldolase
MKKIQILDVTLRDGGYKTNFHFSNYTIERVLNSLDQSGLPYIKVGYRNGPFKLTPNIGPAGLCPSSYLEHCRNWIHNAKLTVMLHPRHIQYHDLVEIKNCGVEAVRICFPFNNPELGFKTVEMVKKLGFDVFTNITRMSALSIEQIAECVIELSQYEPKAIYFADSNGSVTPQHIRELCIHLANKTVIPLGFHAHDNLFQAQANAIASIENGMVFLDSSLSGVGKGAGNLKTEGIVSYLHSQGNRKYDICKILESAEFIKLGLQTKSISLFGKDIILGIFDLSQDDALNLGEFHNIKDYYSRAEKYFQNNKILNRSHKNEENTCHSSYIS